MKSIIALLISIAPIILLATTLQVALDGSQAYSNIQTAVNAAQAGDTVLLHPGHYYQTVDLSGKSQLTLCSLEATTGDTTYVSSTVIDGSQGNNSTILCFENVQNCTIRGLSITGGKGYTYPYSGYPQSFGGGIYVAPNNWVNMINLNIYSNATLWGGGIFINSPSTTYLAGVNIYNNAARYQGGGIGISSDPNQGGPSITFDQVNRCSVYNNFAQWGMDIHWHYIHQATIEVYLDKFTINHWDRYYADYFDYTEPPCPYTVFAVQRGWLQPIQADLYVSPTGSDNNSGLSPQQALKTPSLAMQRIASDTQNPYTVHLLPGEHHNLMLGAYQPLAVKHNTILSGAGEEHTLLYAQDLRLGVGAITFGQDCEDVTVKDLSIQTSSASALFSWGVHNCLLQNIQISNSSVDRQLVCIGATGSVGSTITIKNLNMHHNVAQTYNFGLTITGAEVDIDGLTIRDSRIASMPSDIDSYIGGLDIAVTETLIMKNSCFVNNEHYASDRNPTYRIYTDYYQYTPTYIVDNCLFANNTAHGGAYPLSVNGGTLYMSNCTMANNTSDFYVFFALGCDGGANFVNCLMANDSIFWELKTYQITTLTNCLFSRSDNFLTTGPAGAIIWDTENLLGVDPGFVGGDPSLPSYYYLRGADAGVPSPAIDAGTLTSTHLPPGYQMQEHDLFANQRLYGSAIDIGCYEYPGYTGADTQVNAPSTGMALNNYPNPFNPSTTISYTVPAAGLVKLGVYNIKGQLVKTLVSGTQAAGNHSISWQGKDNNGEPMASGMYLYRLDIGSKSITKKMLMLK